MLLSCCIYLAIEAQSFTLKNVSPKYTVKIDLVTGAGQNVDTDELQGPGTVTLIVKKTGKTLQKLVVPHIALFKSQMGTSVVKGSKPISNCDDNYSIVFGDFNFDGRQDLAICNGTNSGYGLPSYDVFLFSPSANRFVQHRALSNLAQNHLGLFTVDLAKRRLVVFDKSGAAWHQTSFYAVQGERIVLMRQEIQDDTGAKEVITTKSRVHGRWRTTVKRRALPQS